MAAILKHGFTYKAQTMATHIRTTRNIILSNLLQMPDLQRNLVVEYKEKFLYTFSVE